MRSFLQALVQSFAADPVLKIKSCLVAIPVLYTEGQNQTFMDLHACTKHQSLIIVEMQAKCHLMFDERALYYACAIYANRLTKVQLQDKFWYHYLKVLIAIQILDNDSNRAREISVPGRDALTDPLVERMKDNRLARDQYIKHYVLSDTSFHQKLDHLQMIQVELPRAKSVLKKEEPCTV